MKDFFFFFRSFGTASGVLPQGWSVCPFPPQPFFLQPPRALSILVSAPSRARHRCSGSDLFLYWQDLFDKLAFQPLPGVVGCIDPPAGRGEASSHFCETFLSLFSAPGLQLLGSDHTTLTATAASSGMLGGEQGKVLRPGSSRGDGMSLSCFPDPPPTRAFVAVLLSVENN